MKDMFVNDRVFITAWYYFQIIQSLITFNQEYQMILSSENCKSNAMMINLFLLMICHWLVDDNSYYEIAKMTHLQYCHISYFTKILG